MLMATLIHAQIKKKVSKNDYHFPLREDKPSLSSLVSHSSQLSLSRPLDMLLHVYSSTKLPRNTRGNIIRGKTERFKNNFREINW